MNESSDLVKLSFSLEYFLKYNNRKIRTFYAETLVNSILCFCNLERYTHTFYVHNQNYFKGGKKGGKNN